MNYFQDHPELKNALIATLKPGQEIYLVGGTIRDGLLNKKGHDLDFVLSGNVKKYARIISNILNGKFYMLDEKRQTARVLLDVQDKTKKLVLDFAALDQNNIQDNLLQRDFTINAIAYDLRDNKLIDPLGGGKHLLEKKLVPCSDTSFLDDPVRTLRTARFLIDFNLKIDSGTVKTLKEAVPGLEKVSAERLRDELFRLLSGKQIKTAVQLLDHFGILEILCPEAINLQGFVQGKPHVYDAWGHTLAVMSELEKIVNLIFDENIDKHQQNLMDGLTVLHLRKYQKLLKRHFSEWINPNRPAFSLLAFAALYHDTGKPSEKINDSNGRNKFPEHAAFGKKLISKRAKMLALSQHEVKYLETVVGNHMRFHGLPAEDKKNFRVNIFHFFNDCKLSSIDICLLALADSRATYGTGLEQDHWIKKLTLCQTVFDEIWISPSGLYNPPDLITGSDLKNHFSLESGPLIGQILAQIKVAQAAGEINTRENALKLVEQLINPSGL